MPRQVDLSSQNMQLTHDPNNQIGMSTTQLAAYQAQQPALIAQALAASINMLLKGFIDQINLDLKALADGLAALFPGSSNLAAAFVDWVNGAIQGFEQIWNFASGFLTSDSPIIAANLVGNLFPDGMPLAWLTSTPRNELDNGDFRTAIAIAGGSDWRWVDGIYFADSTATGSAAVTADGTTKALRSNIIDVVEGKSVSMSVEVLTDGLTGINQPVQLWAVPGATGPDGDFQPVGEMVLLDSAMPSGGDSGWHGAPMGADSALLQGAFTPDAGVSQVVMRFVVTGDATDGDVYFDHAKAWIVGGWLEQIWDQVTDILDAYANADTQEEFAAAWDLVLDMLNLPHPDSFWTWIVDGFIAPLFGLDSTTAAEIGSDITALQDAQTTANDAFADLLTALGRALTQDPLFSAQQAADITTAWNDYMAILAGTQEDTNNAYQDILTRLLGTDGTLDHSKVNGLQGFVDSILTALGISSGTISGINADISTIDTAQTTANAAFQSLLNGWWEALTGQDSNGDQTVETWASAWNGFTGVLSGTQQDQNNAWTDIWDRLLGLGTDGKFDATKLNGSVPTANLPAAWAAVINDITSFLTTGNWNALGDAWSDLNEALWGQSTVGTTVQQEAIPNGINQAKVDGLQDGWTQLGAALNGDAADAGGWAWLSDIMTNWFGVSSDAHTMAVDATNALANRNNSPTYEGLDETTSANMPLNTVRVGASPIGPTEIVFVRLKQDYTAETPLRAVGFIAVATEEPTEFYVNLRTYDKDTGALNFHAGSTNLNALIPVGNGSNYSDSDWVQYDFGEANALTGKTGDLVAVEFQSSGATATLAGRDISASLSPMGSIPTHPTKKLRNFAADVTKSSYPIPSTIDLASADYTFHGDNLPYVALEITGVTSDPVIHPDKYVTLTSSTTVDVPPWARFVDRIACSAGGGGAGGINGAGSAGGNTTIKVGTNTLTTTGGNGGPGGNTSVAGLAYSSGPGNKVWRGKTYEGGAGVINATPGNRPGAGGGGGGGFFGQYGYAGLPGEWAADTLPLDGSITSIAVTVGVGGAPNMYNGQPSYNAGRGGDGLAYLVFRAS